MNKRRIAVYIAGPLSNPDCTEYLANGDRMIEKALEVSRLGYTPFCPFLALQHSRDCEQEYRTAFRGSTTHETV